MSQTHLFIFAKAFEVPRDFSRKVPWSGFGAEAPTYNAHTKSTAMPCFFNCRNMLELRSKPCFKGLFQKHLKNPKNFCPEYTASFLRKLLRFQGAFHEKSLGQGLGRIAPTDYAHTKNTAYAVFFAFYKILRSFLYIV